MDSTRSVIRLNLQLGGFSGHSSLSSRSEMCLRLPTLEGRTCTTSVVIFGLRCHTTLEGDSLEESVT